MLILHWLQSLYWPETGKGYALGSSWAGDTGTLSIFGLFWISWRRHNCHSRGCPRLGRFPAVEGGGWQYCRKHHSTDGEHLGDGEG